MKKKISFILAVIMILAVMIPAIPASADGGNTFNANDANPTISTAEDYIAFFNAAFVDKNSFSGKTVTLMNDIVLNDTTDADWYLSAKNKFNGEDGPWQAFSGTFDGNGHTLKGVVVTGDFRKDDRAVGIFPCTTSATIKNLTVDGFYVCGNEPEQSQPNAYFAGVGGLIGSALVNVVVDNCVMRNGIVDCVGNRKQGVGTIIGAYKRFDGIGETFEITNCTVEDTVSIEDRSEGTAFVGGIIGAVYDSNRTGLGGLILDFSGSVFQPAGSVGDNATLSPIGTIAHLKASEGNAAVYVRNTNVGVEGIYDAGDYGWFGPDATANSAKTLALVTKAKCYGNDAAPVVKFAGIQTRAEDNAVRFVGLIKKPDNNNFDAISTLGFEVSANGGNKVGPDVIKSTKVYINILENGLPTAAPDGYYYFTFVVSNVDVGTTFRIAARTTVNGVDCYSATYSYTYTSTAQ